MANEKSKHGPRHPSYLYTVYDNKTDFPIIVDGTAQECANVMGVTLNSFHRAVTAYKNPRRYKNKRWTFLKTSFYDRESIEEFDLNKQRKSY